MFIGKVRKNKTSIKLETYFALRMLVNKHFHWEGLPKEIPAWVLEDILYICGCCLFFKGGDKYFVAYPAKMGQLNTYAFMSYAIPITVDGNNWDSFQTEDIYKYNKETKQVEITPRNAILIRNNNLEIPTEELIRPMVERRNYIWQSIGIAEAQCRTKRILVCSDPKMKKVIKQELQEFTDNGDSEAVVTDNTFQNLTRLDANASAQEIGYLWEDLNSVDSMMLNVLGINNNMSQSKKERLISDEVNANNDYIDLAKASFLEQRQFACEQIKETFGIDIKVYSYEDHKKIEMNKIYQENGLTLDDKESKEDNTNSQNDNK